MRLIYLVFITMLTGLAQAQEYSVTVKGISAGKAKLSIVQKDAEYKVQLTIYPNMLAKAFDVNDMREVAIGKIADGKFFPINYKRHELKGKELLSVKFAGNKVNVNSEGEKKSFSIEKYAQDPLTQILQIQNDFKAGKIAWGYYTVTDRKQYYFNAIQKGRRIELSQEKKSDEHVTLWFNEKYQLDRMRKKKDSKVIFDMKKR